MQLPNDKEARIAEIERVLGRRLPDNIRARIRQTDDVPREYWDKVQANRSIREAKQELNGKRVSRYARKKHQQRTKSW